MVTSIIPTPAHYKSCVCSKILIVELMLQNRCFLRSCFLIFCCLIIFFFSLETVQLKVSCL